MVDVAPGDAEALRTVEVGHAARGEHRDYGAGAFDGVARRVAERYPEKVAFEVPHAELVGVALYVEDGHVAQRQAARAGLARAGDAQRLARDRGGVLDPGEAYVAGGDAERAGDVPARRRKSRFRASRSSGRGAPPPLSARRAAAPRRGNPPARP